jgi:hypothetical protein
VLVYNRRHTSDRIWEGYAGNLFWTKETKLPQQGHQTGTWDEIGQKLNVTGRSEIIILRICSKIIFLSNIHWFIHCCTLYFRILTSALKDIYFMHKNIPSWGSKVNIINFKS